MRPFQIVGGMVSPNAVVYARDEEHARELYEARYQTGDKGIGIYPMEPGDVLFIGGGQRYFAMKEYQLTGRETYWSDVL